MEEKKYEIEMSIEFTVIKFKLFLPSFVAISNFFLEHLGIFYHVHFKCLVIFAKEKYAEN
jgi:hypothetical protein